MATTDPATRVLGTALEIACTAPKNPSGYASSAKVPWTLIERLRRQLTEYGIDWEAYQDEHRCPVCRRVDVHTVSCTEGAVD